MNSSRNQPEDSASSTVIDTSQLNETQLREYQDNPQQFIQQHPEFQQGSGQSQSGSNR